MTKPTRPPAELTDRLFLRVTTLQRAKLHLLATAASCSWSEWIRRQIENQPIPAPVAWRNPKDNP